MKIIIELTEEEFRNAARLEEPKKPKTPITKRQKEIMKIARANRFDEAAEFIESFVNTQGYRTGYDEIVKSKWPGLIRHVPEWRV